MRRTNLTTPQQRLLRTLAVSACVAASVAVFVHHSAPLMDMPGMASAETCVSVAAHAIVAPVAPAMLLISVAGLVILFASQLAITKRQSPLARARAGPRELRIPLRC